MKNALLFAIFCATYLIAVLIGRFSSSPQEEESLIPHIGRVEILNGCGLDGAAWRTADFLREKGFDVKNDGITNAPSFNYPFTLVVARQKPLTIAEQIARALSLDADKVILMRDTEIRFDVSVFIGPDIEELLP